MGVKVLYFGGNGHASVRLDGARAALARRSGAPGLVEVPYPGFEDRPRAGSLEAFLEALEDFCQDRDRGDSPALAVASGIGALVALGLRAREALAFPLIFQGPVLWGLEHRWFPRLMRGSLARDLLSRALTYPPVQEHFVRRQFLRPLDATVRARFFEGYARCPGFGDFFRWFTPEWLRTLERRFAERPEGLQRITVWLGGRDHVVGPAEVDATERALGVRWPRVAFPEWGHYPMIDVPEEWADALRDALAAS